VQTLLEKGYSNAIEIDGGFSAWTKAGYPTTISQPQLNI